MVSKLEEEETHHHHHEDNFQSVIEEEEEEMITLAEGEEVEGHVDHVEEEITTTTKTDQQRTVTTHEIEIRVTDTETTAASPGEGEDKGPKRSITVRQAVSSPLPGLCLSSLNSQLRLVGTLVKFLLAFA